MRRLEGDAKSVRSLLGGAKFAIDYYQREYLWETKQVAELIDDLAKKFLESHEPGNERSAVVQYGHYFLGSIIISDKDGQKFIIDGQQRPMPRSASTTSARTCSPRVSMRAPTITIRASGGSAINRA